MLFRLCLCLCLFLLFATPLHAKALSHPMRVVATFSILGEFAQIVGGEQVRVMSLAEADVSPHEYRVRPFDLRSVERSDLLIMNGMGMEGWLGPLLREAKESIRVVNASKGVPMRPGANGGIDPHAWLDVGNAALYVKNICEALVATDPINAQYYKDNADAYLLQLKKLDHSIKIRMGRLGGRSVLLTNHDTFAYFGAAYGLQFLPLQGLKPDPMGSATDFPDVTDKIKQQKISLFFTENVDPPRLMRGVEAMTGGKIVGKLYADALSKDEGATTYLNMMRMNADTMFNVLSR